jgi:hypothetical protein
MAARIIYQAPSTAICWSVYEFFKHFLTSGDSGKADVLSSVTYEKLPTGGSTGGGGGGSSSGGLNSDGAVIVLSAGGPGHVLIKEDILPAA